MLSLSGEHVWWHSSSSIVGSISPQYDRANEENSAIFAGENLWSSKSSMYVVGRMRW